MRYLIGLSLLLAGCGQGTPTDNTNILGNGNCVIRSEGGSQICSPQPPPATPVIITNPPAAP